MDKNKIIGHVPPSKSNICAVIVTYHPDENLQLRINRIAKQVSKVIIVDNNSSDNCLVALKQMSNTLGAKLILNTQNLGIATALNQGFSYAIQSQVPYEWVLTLDQDTLVSNDIIKNLVQSYNECPIKNQVAIVGANYREWTTGKLLYTNKSNKDLWCEVEILPTSGCLTSISSYLQAGKFRDSFFIDYVDDEFCMRLRSHGFKIIISPTVSMTHPLGYYKHSRFYKIVSGKELVSNYTPIRHYYWTRNGVLLAGENLFKDVRWSVRTLYYILLKRLMITVLFEDNKISKLWHIFLGLIHAVSGRTGML